MKFSILFLVSTLITIYSYAQEKFGPGFNPAEYEDLLTINAITHTAGIEPGKASGIAHKYILKYRSAEMGLMNLWELWMRDDNVAVVSFRGTIANPISWLANFYSAMIPATGTIHLNDSTDFKYKLAESPRATVHIGWMIGLGYLIPEVVRELNRVYKEDNIRNVLIIGHSQGGALATLGTSYLRHAQTGGIIPGDIVFKSYCSASPKVGNLYYAYDFDYITRNGMAYTIVNALDWVPETPITIQTAEDFNVGSPFRDLTPILGQQKFYVRWYVNGMFNKLERSTRKAQKRTEKYLGRKMCKLVKKVLPQFEEPAYANNSMFMRAGVPIVLLPDAEYNQKYPEDPAKTFQHHMIEPYLMLLRKAYEVKR